MKRKHLALLPLVIGTLFGAAAQAQQTITFEGRVINSTCIPSVENGGASGTVALPLITSNLLPGLNSVAGQRSFSIALTGCDDSATNTVRAYFWQTNALNGRLSKNSGSGVGWQYELLAGSTPITVGTSATVVEANNTGDPGAVINAGSGGTGVLTYNVRYYRSTAAALTLGDLNATATYVLYSN